jgi:hypothetical protein
VLYGKLMNHYGFDGLTLDLAINNSGNMIECLLVMGEEKNCY